MASSSPWYAHLRCDGLSKYGPCCNATQDTFGAEFKALRAPDITEDGEAAAALAEQQPEPLERNTEHGFWTATPIWSTDSAASGALQPVAAARAVVALDTPGAPDVQQLHCNGGMRAHSAVHCCGADHPGTLSLQCDLARR